MKYILKNATSLLGHIQVLDGSSLVSVFDMPALCKQKYNKNNTKIKKYIFHYLYLEGNRENIMLLKICMKRITNILCYHAFLTPAEIFIP